MATCSVDTSFLVLALLFSLGHSQATWPPIENVALGKQCDQSSILNSSRPAGYAVNGNTDGNNDTFGNNCIYTGLADTSPWWQVNLGRQYPIYTIVVWARTNFVHRMSQVRILIDSQVCYSYGDVISSTKRQMTINCTTGVLYGSTVRLAKYNVPTTAGDNPINLCELQVFSCTADYWGNGCDQTCGACRDGAVCDKVTGYCDIGCAPGYKTTSLCVEVCASGTYGLACSGNCSNNCVDSNACGKVNGTCTCNPGWKPTSLCEEACSKSFYGKDCLSMCGLGCSNNDCDKAVGTCACIPGWQPPFCQQVCPDGRYGQDCLLKCSENCLDVCDKVTGYCTCQPGFLPPNCTQDCPDGYFGQNCQQSCSENCADVCHKVTGHCTCKPGWKFQRCNDKCDSGSYGLNCSNECGNCLNSAPCDRASGSCPQCQGNFQPPLCKVCKTGYYKKECSAACSQNCDSVSCEQDNGHCTCKPGWNPPNCTRVTSDASGNSGSLVGPVVGAVLGASCLLGLSAVVVAALFIRSRRSRASSQNGVNTDINMPTVQAPSLHAIHVEGAPKQASTEVTAVPENPCDQLENHENRRDEAKPYTQLQPDQSHTQGHENPYHQLAAQYHNTDDVKPYEALSLPAREQLATSERRHSETPDGNASTCVAKHVYANIPFKRPK